MKAVVLTNVGPPDVLQLREVAKPAPRDDEVLVKVHATTVTAAESTLRGVKIPFALRLPLGIYLRRRSKPVILGQDLAGEIEEVGKDVTRFKKGDRITAWCGPRLGGYAEYACLRGRGVLATKPDGMTYEQAATLAVGGVDAAYLLRKAGLRSGQKVLINGAGGSIGTFAVQIAKCFGAVVTAVDSTAKLDMLRSIGADRVIDYTREDFTRSGEIYDAILDVIGKAPFSRTVRMLAPDGRFLSANPRLPYRIQGRRMSSTTGKKFIPWTGRTVGEYKQDFDFLKVLFEAGKLRPVIDRCFPLEQTAEAHRYVEQGRKKGNVVITVQSDAGGNA
jgi:NADPH:quinone reductase-like Zn-dependent oxidoreductase